MPRHTRGIAAAPGHSAAVRFGGQLQTPAAAIVALTRHDPVLQIPGTVTSVLGQRLLFEARGPGRLRLGDTATCIVGKPGARRVAAVRYVQVREGAMALDQLEPWRDFAVRSEERYETDLEARISSADLSTAVDARITNISAGGVGLRVDRPLTGSFCELALGVDSFATWFPCRVVGQNADGRTHHLEFVELQPVHKALIRRVTAAFRGSEEARLEPAEESSSTRGARRGKRSPKRGSWPHVRARLAKQDEEDYQALTQP